MNTNSSSHIEIQVDLRKKQTERLYGTGSDEWQAPDPGMKTLWLDSQGYIRYTVHVSWKKKTGSPRNKIVWLSRNRYIVGSYQPMYTIEFREFHFIRGNGIRNFEKTVRDLQSKQLTTRNGGFLSIKATFNYENLLYKYWTNNYLQIRSRLPQYISSTILSSNGDLSISWNFTAEDFQSITKKLERWRWRPPANLNHLFHKSNRHQRPN